MTEQMNVEVVFAEPDRQELVTVTVDVGASVADAISASSLEQMFSKYDLAKLQVGIWGRLVERSAQLQDGDRVEIYRPLTRDPREARRELARAQRFGSSS
jgi:putative ubiquitin-RnfH superfamily antitoxin RatB of RatAB toxin-antitoxin module